MNAVVTVIVRVIFKGTGIDIGRVIATVFCFVCRWPHCKDRTIERAEPTGCGNKAECKYVHFTRMCVRVCRVCGFRTTGMKTKGVSCI